MRFIVAWKVKNWDGVKGDRRNIGAVIAGFPHVYERDS